MKLIDKISDIAVKHSFDGVNVDCLEHDLEKALTNVYTKEEVILLIKDTWFELKGTVPVTTFNNWIEQTLEN